MVPAAKETGHPPTLNKTKLKAKASPELGVTLLTPGHQRLGQEGHQTNRLNNQRLDLTKPHELLKRKWVVPA